MNANKVTGEEFQAARISLGLSISMVGKQLLDGNRNTLSHFEKEKGTLTLRDKKKLINFYEEYGYDFGQPDDEEVLSEHVKENIEHSIGSLEKVDDREVSAAMIELVHDVMDVLSLVKRPVVQESSPVLSAESQQLSDELVKHFEADKQGQFKDTTGFFGDSASGRGENLMGLLAYLKLQELQALMPDLLSLSLQKTTEKSDNRRLLRAIGKVFDYESLSEFKRYSSEQIA